MGKGTEMESNMEMESGMEGMGLEIKSKTEEPAVTGPGTEREEKPENVHKEEHKDVMSEKHKDEGAPGEKQEDKSGEAVPEAERELAGKVALVTGAGRGIGRAIAYALALKGATVLVNYNGSKEAAMEAVARIVENGGRGEAVGCDVSDFGACGKMVEDIIRKYSHVDILVNNAGVTRDNLVMRMTEEEYDKVLDTNLKGAFNTIRHLSRYFLKQRSGKIINIASVSGVMGNPGQANYSASKAGLIGLTKSVARELASRGICVNAVAPGFIDTDMTVAMPEKAKNAAIATVPMGRMGNVEDVAGTVLFLAGSRSDYITGQVICVDGGMAM